MRDANPHKSDLRRSPHYLELDTSPRRSVSAVNVRRDDKALFDVLQAWWSVERGRPLTQWEAFSVLLAAAMENPDVRLPREVAAPRLAA